MIGNIVTVTIDRPLGSCHPEHPDLHYPVNYGFIKGMPAPDGDYQDAYVLGVDQPLRAFTGKVIAIIHRVNDLEDKWVVAPDNLEFTEAEIIKLTFFQEKYFKSIIIT